MGEQETTGKQQRLETVKKCRMAPWLPSPPFGGLLSLSPPAPPDPKVSASDGVKWALAADGAVYHQGPRLKTIQFILKIVWGKTAWHEPRKQWLSGKDQPDVLFLGHKNGANPPRFEHPLEEHVQSRLLTLTVEGFAKTEAQDQGLSPPGGCPCSSFAGLPLRLQLGGRRSSSAFANPILL